MDPSTMPPGAPDITPAAPAAVPAPAPAAPTPVPAPMPVQQATYSSGGFLSDISPVKVGMFLLTSLALFYSIYYSRQAIKNLKTTKAQDRKDIDEIKGNLQSVMGENYKTL